MVSNAIGCSTSFEYVRKFLLLSQTVLQNDVSQYFLLTELKKFTNNEQRRKLSIGL